MEIASTEQNVDTDLKNKTMLILTFHYTILQSSMFERGTLVCDVQHDPRFWESPCSLAGVLQFGVARQNPQSHHNCKWAEALWYNVARQPFLCLLGKILSLFPCRSLVAQSTEIRHTRESVHMRTDCNVCSGDHDAKRAIGKCKGTNAICGHDGQPRSDETH